MQKSVILLANAWGAGVDNPTSKHRIAFELARRGCRVLWVEGAGMRTPNVVGSGSDRGRILRKLFSAFRRPRLVWQGGEGESGGSIRCVSPLSIPLPTVSAIRHLNGWIYQVTMRVWSGCLKMRQPVLVNYVPVLAHAMAHWSARTGGTCIYHCVDRWDAFDMYDSAVMAAMDKACCIYADRIIASSADLGTRCRRYSQDVDVVMHGVDFDHFSSALSDAVLEERPRDLPGGTIIGFFGLLSEWVNQNLLMRIACEIPEAQVVLIGTADVPVDRLAAVPNIHLLGSRQFAELPRYVAHFDVGIIPFEVNELTKAVNPIKLREMLAAGCPVVSTPLPEVAALEASIPYLSVCGSEDAFVDACRQLVASPLTPDQRRAISEPMKNETWSHKVDEMALF
jgi:glycosyltransferase involved in cell wall biosynthesis